MLDLAIATELLRPSAATAATAITDLCSIADSPFWYALRVMCNARMLKRCRKKNRPEQLFRICGGQFFRLRIVLIPSQGLGVRGAGAEHQ
jgi:hypothetical protein